MKEVAEKFGVSQKHISKLIKEIPQKANLLFVNNPSDFFENLPQNCKTGS